METMNLRSDTEDAYENFTQQSRAARVFVLDARERLFLQERANLPVDYVEEIDTCSAT